MLRERRLDSGVCDVAGGVECCDVPLRRRIANRGAESPAICCDPIRETEADQADQAVERELHTHSSGEAC